MYLSFEARKKDGRHKGRRNWNEGPIATWDASETSVGETGAAEGVKKGNGREAKGNKNEKKALPERLG